MDVKKIQLFIIAVWICFTLAACGGGITSTTNTTASVVVFSDVHFNPFYAPSLFSRLAAADAGEWAGIFQTSHITAPMEWAFCKACEAKGNDNFQTLSKKGD